LAEVLAKQGYVSLRCEKLAYRLLVGRESEEERGTKISMESSWREIAGAVELIRGEYGSAGGGEEVKVFALGNSEGSIHVENYQLKACRNVIHWEYGPVRVKTGFRTHMNLLHSMVSYSLLSLGSQPPLLQRQL